MTSWHTFSPNGHWLAFSSKARSPYTQLMLTHIDANGNDSPAIIVDNTTAANRAVNIPEFVNVAPGGLATIDPQAMDFYRLVDDAYKLVQNNRIPEAIATLRNALQRDPDNAMAHYNLATLLSGSNQERDALDEYRRANGLSPENPLFIERLAVSMVLNGDPNGAILQLQNGVALLPNSPELRFNLGYFLEAKGEFVAALEPLQRAVELSQGRNGRFLAELANAYSKTGHFAEAIDGAHRALDLAVQTHDEQLEKNTREALDHYEAASAIARPQ